MRAFVSLLGLSLLAAPAAASPPVRVASLNLCTDELLLALADPAQILSVTHLARQAAEAPGWQAARRYPTNDGSLLSVAPQRPDLVLSMGGGAADRAGVARRLGMRVVTLPYPQRLADVEASIARVATLLGRQTRGEQLLAQIAALKRSAPAARHDAIYLGGGGRSVAADGLAADWMALAGLRQRPLAGDRVALEQLLVSPPQVLLRSDYRAGEYSGEQRWLAHPIARRARSARTLVTDGRRWTCMGPGLVPEILRLRRALAR